MAVHSLTRRPHGSHEPRVSVRCPYTRSSTSFLQRTHAKNPNLSSRTSIFVSTVRQFSFFLIYPQRLLMNSVVNRPIYTSLCRCPPNSCRISRVCGRSPGVGCHSRGGGGFRCDEEEPVPNSYQTCFDRKKGTFISGQMQLQKLIADYNRKDPVSPSWSPFWVSMRACQDYEEEKSSSGNRILPVGRPRRPSKKSSTLNTSIIFYHETIRVHKCVMCLIKIAYKP